MKAILFASLFVFIFAGCDAIVSTENQADSNWENKGLSGGDDSDDKAKSDQVLSKNMSDWEDKGRSDDNSDD